MASISGGRRKPKELDKAETDDLGSHRPQEEQTYKRIGGLMKETMLV
jgi:hypothetical protein